MAKRAEQIGVRQTGHTTHMPRSFFSCAARSSQTGGDAANSLSSCSFVSIHLRCTTINTHMARQEGRNEHFQTCIVEAMPTLQRQSALLLIMTLLFILQRSHTNSTVSQSIIVLISKLLTGLYRCIYNKRQVLT